MNQKLPQSVIDADHNLDRVIEKSSSELIELRWHWIADESNPERVSIADYARAVGHGDSSIRRYVLAHDLIREAGSMTVGEALIRVMSSAEVQAVTEAVAAAHGVTYQTAYQNPQYRNEIRTVRSLARDSVERTGKSSVEEEAPHIADFIARSRSAPDSEQPKIPQDYKLVRLQGLLASGVRYLREAEKYAATVDWSEEDRAMLKGGIALLRQMVGRIEERIAGIRPDELSEADTLAAVNQFLQGKKG